MSEEEGVFCMTAGSVFTTKHALMEHYKSDFHLFNLKRRVAGLPPVTREWFETKKAQIAANAKQSSGQQIWMDPLSKKKFQSEATYEAFIHSKKYQSLLKKASLTRPPPPHITEASQRESPTIQIALDIFVLLEREENKNEDEEDSEAWDLCMSLFDNVMSESFEANVEYMFKKFGFFFPNSEFLIDAKGLLQYLGAKLKEGHIPLYCSGLNPDAKQFGSLKAVQSHMIDTQRCTLLFENNEEEYEDYYDFDSMFDTKTGSEIVLGFEPEEMQGFELTIQDDEGRSKIIGNREFAHLYRQRHQRMDQRESVTTGKLVAKYRSLGIRTRENIPEDIKQAKRLETHRRSRNRLKMELKQNVNDHLPRNVPY